MRLVQEMAVHFWEQGRLLTPHVMELVSRGLLSEEFVSAKLEGYVRARSELLWEGYLQYEREDTLELIGQATRIPRPGGRRPRPPRKEASARRRENDRELGGLLSARQRYPVLLELGRAVSPERGCRDGVTAAIALWKCPPERLAAALAGAFASGEGRLCQVMAWFDVRAIEGYAALGRSYDAPMPRPGAAGPAVRLAVALGNARRSVLPATANLVRNSASQVGKWAGRHPDMPEAEWDTYAGACLMLANTGRVPGKWRRIPAGCPLAADPTRYLEAAVEADPASITALLEVAARLGWEGAPSLRVPPGWPAMRATGR